MPFVCICAAGSNHCWSHVSLRLLHSARVLVSGPQFRVSFSFSFRTTALTVCCQLLMLGTLSFDWFYLFVSLPVCLTVGTFNRQRAEVDSWDLGRSFSKTEFKHNYFGAQKVNNQYQMSDVDLKNTIQPSNMKYPSSSSSSCLTCSKKVWSKI